MITFGFTGGIVKCNELIDYMTFFLSLFIIYLFVCLFKSGHKQRSGEESEAGSTLSAQSLMQGSISQL